MSDQTPPQMNKQNEMNLIDTENKFTVMRREGGWGMGKRGEGGNYCKVMDDN